MMSCKHVQLKVFIQLLYLEISSLYSDFVPDSLNIPENDSYGGIPRLMLDPVL